MSDKMDGGGSSTPDNVTVLNGQTKAEKRRRVKELIEGALGDDVSRKEAINTVVLHMQRRGNLFDFAPFPSIICIQQADQCRSLGLKVGMGLVQPVTTDAAEMMIIKWLCEHVRERILKKVSTTDAPAIARAYLSSAEAVEVDIMGEHYDDRRDERLAYNRPLWRRRRGVALDECPMFAEICSRTQNADEMCAWFGGLFYDDSAMEQCLYLFGPGGNGKTTLVKMFGRIMGSAFAMTDVGLVEDRWWTSGLIGKRLVSFGDFGRPSWLNSPKWKSITGDRDMVAERKFEKSFTFVNKAKFVFTSNEPPEPGDNRADRRRIVWASVAQIDSTFDTKYPERLWAEAEAVYNYCRDAYERLNVSGYINISDEVMMEVLDEDCSIFDEFLAHRFELGEKFNMPSSMLRRITEASGLGRGKYRKFMAHIRNRHNVSVGRAGDWRKGEPRCRLLKGLKPRADVAVDAKFFPPSYQE